jgi:hypothetical protein
METETDPTAVPIPEVEPETEKDDGDDTAEEE